jgi:hypothetical protein
VSAPLGRKAQLRDRDFIVIQGSEVPTPVQVVNVSELLVHSHFGDSKLPVYRQINSKVSASLVTERLN